MKRTFAVILMDVQMPDMDGYETARLIRMRDESEHTPIIFITAHAAEEAQIPVAYASGAVDFIFAPIVPDILRAKVSVFVELFLKSRELEQSLSEVTLGEQFRDSEARTRSVLENVADGIVTVERRGRDRVVQPRRGRAVRLQRAGGDRPAVLADGRPEAPRRLRQSRGRRAADPEPAAAGAAARPSRWAAARTARRSRWSST